MLNLLIVDDEQVERQGVDYLVHDFGLDLLTFEAENGIKALEFITANHVDILITDIKMPFMDGLDLAREANKINPRLKVIIFSAYGEFDYARKAMENSAIYYLLKPVDPAEFFNIISKVIKLCSDEKDKERKITNLLESYNKSLIYEKEKLLTDLVNGAVVEEGLLQHLGEVGIDLQCDNAVLLLADLKKSFYSSRNDEFVKLLKKEITYEFEYLNLNENQSIIFFKNLNIQTDRQLLKVIGEKIMQAVHYKFDMKICLIFSDTVKSIPDYHREYMKLEQMADFGFFFDSSTILFTDENSSSKVIPTEWIDKILESIYGAFDSGDSMYAVKAIEQLFDMFKTNKGGSSLYMMYCSAEILKMTYKKLSKSNDNFQSSLEKIFSKDNLEELRDLIINTIIDLGIDKQKNSDEECKRVINMVIRIIEEEYSNNVGLEYVADKVHLTPTYLSYLFKRETGHSFLKYLTQYRLEKAVELIQGTNMKIVNICNKVGYTKLSYFCMLFKNNFGVTPSRYREERR